MRSNQRAAINLIPPYISGTLISGSVPILISGTWNRETEKVYSLHSSGSPIPYLDKVSLSSIQSYTFGIGQRGPVTIKEFALIGGQSVESTSSIDHAPLNDPFRFVWWDPATLASGSISSWMDRIAGISASQDSGAKMPICSLSGFSSSYNGISFNASQVLESSQFGTLIAGRTQVTVTTILWDFYSATTAKVFWELSPTTVSNNGGIVIYVADTAAERLNGGARGAGAGTCFTHCLEPLSTAKVVSVGWDLSIGTSGSVKFIRVNGVAQPLTGTVSTALVGVASGLPLYIGGRGTTPTLGYTGSCGDIIARLTSNEDTYLDANERYVGSKYNLSW